MATSEQYRAAVYRRLQQAGLTSLWPLVDYIGQRESGWQGVQSRVPDPQGPNGRENSWGPLQLLIDYRGQGGVGSGYTAQQLLDPELHAQIAVGNIAQSLSTGASVREAVSPWHVTTAGGDPQMESLIQAAEKGPTQAGEQSYPMSGPTGQETTMSEWRQLAEEQWATWEQELANMNEQRQAQGKQSLGMGQYLSTYYDMSSPPSSKALYLLDMQKKYGSMEATGPEPMSEYQRWDVGHTEYKDELDRAYKEIDAKVAAGTWDSDRAIDEWTSVQNNITNRMTEAGSRGAEVAGIMEDRAKLTTSSPYFPGFEGPDSLASQIMGRRGLTAPTLMGTPTSQLPDPWESFQQGQTSVGLPAESPGVAGYPQVTNPYTNAMGGYANLPDPFQQFQDMGNGSSGGAAGPYTGGSADMVSNLASRGNYRGPDLNAWLDQLLSGLGMR
jgi:hypothetical protein